MRQLHAQNRCLNSIQAAVCPELIVIIALHTPVVSQPPHVLGVVGIARCNQSRVAVSAQVLGRVKAEGGSNSQRSRPPPAPSRSDRLGRILDDRNLELLGEFLKGIHVGTLPVQVNRQYGPNPARLQLSPGTLGIEMESGGIDIGKNRSCARPRNGACRSQKTEGSSQDCISRLNTD